MAQLAMRASRTLIRAGTWAVLCATVFVGFVATLLPEARTPLRPWLGAAAAFWLPVLLLAPTARLLDKLWRTARRPSANVLPGTLVALSSGALGALAVAFLIHGVPSRWLHANTSLVVAAAAGVIGGLLPFLRRRPNRSSESRVSLLGTDQALEVESDDRFGTIARTVEELLDAIETGYAEARPPTANSIALLGEWGSGKSSVLNCLAERLTERGHSDAKWAELLLVRIDAWELHSPDALLRAFVGAITGSLCDRWFLPTLSAKARSYVRAVSAAGEARIGALVDWLLTPPSGESEPSYILQSLLAPATRQVFDGHSADYRGGVLLVIDELDRLEPEQLHALLRLIGAVKRVPWITTVIAAEYRRIQAALTTAEGPAAPLDRLDAEAAKYFSRVVIMPRCTDA